MTRRLIIIAGACAALTLPASAAAHTGMEKLDTPVEREGLKITEQVSRMVWTGNPKTGGIVKPGQFEEFPISTQVPEGEAGSFLTFRAFQAYRDGERVRWTGAPEAEHPAPRVKLLAPATAARRSTGA